MEILRSITFYAESKVMPFLVIGGHALNAHGLDRHTGDLDLLVPRSMKQQWLELMRSLRYTPGQDGCTFARFRPDNLAAWPIDLMFVDDATFEKMRAESVLAEFGAVKAPVAAVRHLIALKMHALKTYQEHREARDFSDLLYLIKKSQLADAELQPLCDKYGTPELLKRLRGVLLHE